MSTRPTLMSFDVVGDVTLGDSWSQDETPRSSFHDSQIRETENLVMSPARLRTKNYYVGEDQKRFTLPDHII
jgi:hypothetical protein